MKYYIKLNKLKTVTTVLYFGVSRVLAGKKSSYSKKHVIAVSLVHMYA